MSSASQRRPRPAGDRHADSADVLNGLLPFVAGPAIVASIFPGFLLCVPGLILVGLVVIPMVAAVLVAGALSLPVLGVRAAGRTLSARRRPASSPAPERGEGHAWAADALRVASQR